jgi:hypothetical protein
MEKEVIKETKSLTYLLFAMIAFGFLGLEFGVLFISRIIDGRSINQIGNWPIHWYGAIAHWIITIIVWLIGVSLITLWARKKNILDQLVDFKQSKKGYYLILIAVGVVIVSAVVQFLISGDEIPQVYSEYKGFVNMYGSYAFIVTVFQVLYYFVEMLLVFIMIVLFQKFGELVFKNKYIPYGSVGLMLTWGMIHFVSHPAGALYVTIWALVPGLLYIYGEKRFIPVYILLVLGFIL